MLDRKGWQTERIGAGDLHVIRMVLASEEPMDRGMREALLAGLHVAAQGSERTLQAHALRLLGEWHEQEGAIQEARSEERRVGKECGRPCRSRGAPVNLKKKTKK